MAREERLFSQIHLKTSRASDGFRDSTASYHGKMVARPSHRHRKMSIESQGRVEVSKESGFGFARAKD